MLQLTAALHEGAGRSPSEPYEVVAALDPVPTPAAYGEAGTTWWLAAPEWDGISVDQVRGVIRDGPPAPRQAAAP
jgi:hypothetical protein